MRDKLKSLSFEQRLALDLVVQVCRKKKIQRDRRTSGYVIAYIEPNGLVDKDGRFKVGDELINVNGHSLRGLSMEAARNVLRQLSGHVDIIVARQPQETPPSTNAGKSDYQAKQTKFFFKINT